MTIPHDYGAGAPTGTSFYNGGIWFGTRVQIDVTGFIEEVVLSMNQPKNGIDATPGIYSDNAGSPQNLLADGPTLANVVAGDNVLPLDAPLAVTAGDYVWIGTYQAMVGSITANKMAGAASVYFLHGSTTLPPTAGGLNGWGDRILQYGVGYYEESEGIEIAKTNLYIAVGPGPGVLLAKTNLYIADNGQPEGPTAEQRVNKLAVEAAVNGTTTIQADKVSVEGAVLSLTREIQADALSYTIPLDQEKTFQANKVAVQVVCRGKEETAYVRAWTATLDGHDYYFLQLQEITLVYDIHAEQWYNWGTANRELWRGQIGIDWNANLGKINGGLTDLGASSILVGDYATGSLYFLHTNLMEDQDPDGIAFIPFQRIVYGQIPLRGHDYVACNGVELAGSIGETPTITDMEVNLSYSDDQGHTFEDAGSIELAAGQYQYVVQWGSLGSFKGPGRLFKIEDWGGIYRIDSLDLDDGEDEE